MSNGLETILNEGRVFEPITAFVEQANISGMAAYQALCDEAARDYEGYWARLAREQIVWRKPFTKILNESSAPSCEWFSDGELNVSYNCLDRHLATQPDKTALIFEADDGTVTKITYRELHARVCQFSNALKLRNIKKNDRVVIYMPMSIEVVVAMQACARIGAIHSVVFGGFSSKSLHGRIENAEACAVITADAQMRGGKTIPLKLAVDEALSLGGCETVHTVMVYRRAGLDVQWDSRRDVWWHDAITNLSPICEPE